MIDFILWFFLNKLSSDLLTKKNRLLKHVYSFLPLNLSASDLSMQPGDLFDWFTHSENIYTSFANQNYSPWDLSWVKPLSAPGRC